ncbi:MAG: hypothetical protein HY657_07575 [Acidobacteria bacterium]|nr:hypothetical protein [Acidobacteriota bacterium]
MTTPGDSHDADRLDDEVAGPSNRAFGLLFAIVFAAVALAPIWRGGPVRFWALAVAAVFGLAALAMPRALEPLNRLWLRLGLAMHRVINPVAMAALFYLAVTPMGLARRALRAGLVRRLRANPLETTYWIDRVNQPFSRMDQQF